MKIKFAVDHILESLPDGGSMCRRISYLLVFFDDIKNAPEDLLLRVFEFLGVSTDDKYLRKDVKKVINPTMQKVIPEEHFRLLMDVHESELKEINKRYGRSWY